MGPPACRGWPTRGRVDARAFHSLAGAGAGRPDHRHPACEALPCLRLQHAAQVRVGREVAHRPEAPLRIERRVPCKVLERGQRDGLQRSPAGGRTGLLQQRTADAAPGLARSHIHLQDVEAALFRSSQKEAEEASPLRFSHPERVIVHALPQRGDGGHLRRPCRKVLRRKPGRGFALDVRQQRDVPSDRRAHMEVRHAGPSGMRK